MSIVENQIWIASGSNESDGKNYFVAKIFSGLAAIEERQSGSLAISIFSVISLIYLYIFCVSFFVKFCLFAYSSPIKVIFLDSSDRNRQMLKNR